MAISLSSLMTAGRQSLNPDQIRASLLLPPAASQAPATPEQSANPITQAYQNRYLNDYEQLKAEYQAHEESKGGKIINTDVAREMSPEYRADRTKSADVHEPASAFMKRYYAEKLSQPTPRDKDNTVVFSAGGTGAGKTTALNMLEANDPALARSEMIYDTNMNKFETADQKIKQALDAKRKVRIIYTYRDPAEALEHGALARADRMEKEKGSGRTVPIEEHLKTHIGARKVIDELQKKYKNNPKVDIQVVDNSLGRGNARASQLDKLPKLNENEVKRRLHETLERVRATGIGGTKPISDAIYHGTRGNTR
jgi:hypothetical protein